MSREMIIYWYTTKKQFNEIEPGQTWCIGEVDPNASKYFGMSTAKAAETRVREELGKVKDGAHIGFDDISDLEYDFFEFPNPNNKEKGMDKDIHAVLKTIGCKQIATEWFNTSPDEIRRVIRHIVDGSPLGTKYELRKRQGDVIAVFKKALDNKQKKFGLFAMPRFGKTVCSFEMMNLLFDRFPNKKYIFFISAKLDAEQALREDYYKFDQSCNFKLCLYDSDKKVTVEDLEKDKYVFFASKQWFDGKTLEDIQKRFPCVNREDCAAVFFDEAHFARMTENAQGTIRLLNPIMQIDITGTPFRLKTNEDYDDNNSYVYSVLDEYDDYENAENKEAFRLKNPEMVYITPKNEFFKTDSSFGEFFDSDGCRESIQEWVEKTFYGGQFNIDGKPLPITNAIVVLPPRRKYCDLFTSAVNELVRANKYAIKCTKTTTKDNDDRDYIPDNEQRFKEWNRMCKNEPNCFHLLVTIGKGLQAVSFPDCHAVIMLNDMTSPEQYIQAAFRSKTPNDVKKEAYVVDYNKGRTLQIIDTFIKNHLFVRACDSNYKTEYQRALSRIQIRDHTLVLQEYTFEEIFQTFISNWNIERITDSIDFDIDRLVNKIDLSKVKLSDLQKPHQLTLQLTERGDEYEHQNQDDQGTNDDGNGEQYLAPDWLEKHIEKLKSDLIRYGYIPFGGKETDRLKDIDPEEIRRRELPVGKDDDTKEVWSYLGGDGDWDDIYIDESGLSPSTVRWKYVINNRFVNVTGEVSHGDGAADIKKAKAFINAIIRYLPAYFLVSGVPNGFDDFKDRFGRQTISEKHKERQLFREFMGMGIDYRYIIEILKVCDAGSREQIIAYCADKVAKCYQDNKLVPEKVLELLWVYKKDGSRPVPKELADIMRNGKNYDIAVCGGYWLTDNTTKMYITDSFAESEIIKKLRPNIAEQVIYSKDILQTLEKQKESIMKFKAFIMNPPYGNLHLPILKEMIEMIVENGGHGVSLQPVRWLQDPLVKYKKSTDFSRYNEVLKNSLADIQIYSSTEVGRMFEAVFTMDLGIYEFSKGSNYNLDKLYKDPLLEKIVDTILSTDKQHTTIHAKMEKDKRMGIRVRVCDIQDNGRGGNGGRKSHIGLYRTQRIENGLVDGKDWTDCVQKNQCSRQSGAPIPYSIEFNSINEADNFIKSTKTIFWQYLMLKMHRDINVPNQWLPFMNDYSEPWTDERFYAYFDITPDEQKIIEETVKDAKK